MTLAGWLAVRAEQVAGKRVLELGAGVGLAGLMARHLGAQVPDDHRALQFISIGDEHECRLASDAPFFNHLYPGGVLVISFMKLYSGDSQQHHRR